MKRFFFYLLAIMTMVACSKENNEPQPQPEPQPDPTPVASFNISVQEDKLAAFSVTFDIVPDDKEAKYYYDIIHIDQTNSIGQLIRRNVSLHTI